jgi:hypothetical protein
MLSPSTLERVSVAYRRGYCDGYARRPQADSAGVRDEYILPFANGDYADGYKAGANDRKWEDKRRIES